MTDSSHLAKEPDQPIDWADLEALAPPASDRVEGPTNAQARLRLFGRSEEEVRVVLYRDHHAWCHQGCCPPWPSMDS